MKYLSVCSGIEAATVAWHHMGWEPVAFSEIEKFPSQVLAHHYPAVPNWGDMTKFKEWPDACVCRELGHAEQGESGTCSSMEVAGRRNANANQNGGKRINERRSTGGLCGTAKGVCNECGGTIVDVLVGGTPCQSFSVAGLRKGLADPRGNLMLTYLAIAAKYRPKWVVWENVPGVLSSNGGNDFASLLRGLGELGYGFAYRILDAQYFGVAQRRRRVFVVGCFGDWQRAAAVLFERYSLQGHPAPRREKGKEVAPTVGTGAPFSRTGNDRVETEAFVAVTPTLNAHFETKQGLENQHINAGGGCSLPELSLCLNAGGMGRQDAESETLIPTRGGRFGEAYPIDTMNHIGRKDSHSLGDFEPGAPSYTLTKGHSHAVAFSFDSLSSNSMKSSNPVSGCREVDLAKCLDTTNPDPSKNQGGHAILQSMQVRRLTPVECERLQGFPDGYTDIKPNGKPTADGPRYKALGNSMAVPVMRFIGERVASVEAISQIEEMFS